MTDPVLMSHALRGVPYTCRRGLHRMRLMTRVKSGELYTTTVRCLRCGLLRQEIGRV